MTNIWTIAQREYRSYFASPIAYAVAFFFMILLGWFFYQSLVSAILQAAASQTAPGADIIISPMVTLLLFTMPAITMRSIAEEQRSGTMELILTAPVRDWELVVGKWLGGLLLVLSILLVTFLVYPFALNSMVKPGIDQGLLLCGYLGLVLMVSSLVALGVFISSLFSNQIAAFFTSLAIVLLMFIVRPLSTTAGGTLNQLVGYLNFIDHYLGFYRGVINLSDITYYLSFTALALFLGTVSVETRRWR
jgi:ABC-2 type transport system permease protein